MKYKILMAFAVFYFLGVVITSEEAVTETRFYNMCQPAVTAPQLVKSFFKFPVCAYLDIIQSGRFTRDVNELHRKLECNRLERAKK